MGSGFDDRLARARVRSGTAVQSLTHVHTVSSSLSTVNPATHVPYLPDS